MFSLCGSNVSKIHQSGEVQSRSGICLGWIHYYYRIHRGKIGSEGRDGGKGKEAEEEIRFKVTLTDFVLCFLSRVSIIEFGGSKQIGHELNRPQKDANLSDKENKC